MINKIKIGPPHASVKNCNVSWEAFKNEFESFEIQS